MSINASGEIPRYPDELQFAAAIINGVNTGSGGEVPVSIGRNRHQISLRQLLQLRNYKAAAAVLRRRRSVREGCGAEESGGVGKGMEGKGGGISGMRKIGVKSKRVKGVYRR